eukprot:5378205-Amphidinium_carterae.1
MFRSLARAIAPSEICMRWKLLSPSQASGPSRGSSAVLQLLRHRHGKALLTRPMRDAPIEPLRANRFEE